MADSSIEKKEDSLEESLSSEEWTIIDQRESKIDNICNEESATEDSNSCKEPVITEDTCEIEETKSTLEHVEEIEDAAEKDAESDDVSILSDESESEQLVEEGKIQKIQWQVDQQSNESRSFVPNVSLGESSSPHSLISSTCLICSLLAVTLAIVIAGRVAHLQDDDIIRAADIEIDEKLKELTTIEEKLKELIDVKEALDQIRISMPEMKLLKDHLTYQKYEKNKFKYSLHDYKSFENLDKENIFDSNIENDGLEMLEAMYTNVCLIFNKVNTSNLDELDNSCRIPKILSDMITFKRNVKVAFKNTQETPIFERRMFIDAEKKLDLISESLLSEFLNVFTRFSFKMQERLNKFERNLYQRLCLFYDFDNPLYTNLLDHDFLKSYCKVSADPIKFNYESIADHLMKLESYENKKNTMDEQKEDGNNDYKSNRPYKKFKDAKEDFTNASEGESFDGIDNIRSKGEIRYRNWLKNNHEKEKYYHGENKLKRNEKIEKNNKNHYKHKKEPKSVYDKLIEINKYGEKIDDSLYRKYYKSDRKRNNRGDYDHNQHFPEPKQDHDDNFQLHYNRKYQDFDQKSKSKRDRDNVNQFETKRNVEYGRKVEKKKDGKRTEDDNSKFIIRMDDNEVEGTIKNDHQERQKYKNKEYVIKPENFKESKYAKYDNREHGDRQDKYPTGEWQIQRFASESED